jgi:competence protein ComEC
MIWLSGAVLGLLVLAPGAYAQAVKVAVIDRGQADGIVVRTPNRQWVVIDGGTNRQQADLMHHWGVTTVAVAIISHRHFDHNGGMDNVLSEFTIQRFIGRLDNCPGVQQDDNIRDILANRGIPAEDPNNQTFTIDGVDFTILPTDPVDNRCPIDENNNSVVVRMDFGNFSMLFTGDAEDEERDWLVANHANVLDVDVLKAAHHGADNGWSDPWLSAITPERVVISAGVNDNHESTNHARMMGHTTSRGDEDSISHRTRPLLAQPASLDEIVARYRADQ